MIEKLNRRTPIGRPHHGIVKSGTLTLPNSATLAHAQPSDGTVRTVHPPFAPGWTASPEAIAADADAGRIWLDYLVVSGADNMVYGAELGDMSWIYCYGNERWLVTLASYGNPCTVSIERFGAFGLAPDSDTREVAHPEYWIPDTGYSFKQVHGDEVYQALGPVTARLVDWSPTGHRAVFGLYASLAIPFAPGAGHADMYEAIPVGFVEVRLSNGGTAAGVHAQIVTLANTTACMATVTGVSSDAGLYCPGTSTHEEVYQTLANRTLAYWYQGDIARPVKLSVTRRAEHTLAFDGPQTCGGATVTASVEQTTEASIAVTWGEHTVTFPIVISATQTRTMYPGDVDGNYTSTTDNTWEVSSGILHHYSATTAPGSGNCYDGERTAVAQIDATPMRYAIHQKSTPTGTDDEGLYEWPPGLVAFSPLAAIIDSTAFLPRISTCQNRKFIALIAETQGASVDISGTPTTYDETILLYGLGPNGPATETDSQTFGVLTAGKRIYTTLNLLTNAHQADVDPIAFV